MRLSLLLVVMHDSPLPSPRIPDCGRRPSITHGPIYATVPTKLSGLTGPSWYCLVSNFSSLYSASTDAKSQGWLRPRGRILLCLPPTKPSRAEAVALLIRLRSLPGVDCYLTGEGFPPGHGLPFPHVPMPATVLPGVPKTPSSWSSLR